MTEAQLKFDFSPPSSALPQLWTPDDIYAGCDQKTIEVFAEDRRVERKRFEVSQKDFAAYLSMWSNTQPAGGVISSALITMAAFGDAPMAELII